MKTPRDLDTIARRFPLLPRAKPVCRSLKERVAQVQALAEEAELRHPDALVRSAEAYNLAALITSDSGQPELAQSLCWRQARIFHTGQRPYRLETAKLALQPLINIGRLFTRAGNGEAAYEVFETLFNAVKTGADGKVAGNAVRLTDLVAREDQARLAQWLWTVMLADGTHALTRAGRWDEARKHIERHRGIGKRLLDGRQVAILAQSSADAALRLLDASSLEADWERPLATCLRVLCLTRSGRSSAPARVTMVNSFLRYRPRPEHAVFHTRFGAAVVDLAHGSPQTVSVVRKLVAAATNSGDAYAAFELLPYLQIMTKTDRRTLRDLVHEAGLGEELPIDLADTLIQAALSMEVVMRDALGHSI